MYALAFESFVILLAFIAFEYLIIPKEQNSLQGFLFQNPIALLSFLSPSCFYECTILALIEFK